jgi:hypothetical protein
MPEVGDGVVILLRMVDPDACGVVLRRHFREWIIIALLRLHIICKVLNPVYGNRILSF